MKTFLSYTVVDPESKYAMVYEHFQIYQQAKDMEAKRIAYNSYGQDPKGYADAKKAMLKNRVVQIGEYKIETWYKREHRDWITQVKDGKGNQVGDAIYSGNRDDAAVSHCWKIIEIIKREYNIMEQE